MYHEIVGDLYEETREMSVKDIAKVIRTEIRQSSKNGIVPDGYRYSVRYSKGAGYRAIDIVIGVPEDIRSMWYEYERNNYVPFMYATDEQLTGDYIGLRPLSHAICFAKDLHAKYNFYEAPIYGDGCSVRYFGDVSWERMEIGK